MPESLTGLMTKYLGFFLVITVIMMAIFLVEAIGRISGKTNVKGRRIFTLIHITLGSSVAALILFAFREQIMAELQSMERITPWIIGISLSVLTAVFIQQGSKTTK